MSFPRLLLSSVLAALTACGNAVLARGPTADGSRPAAGADGGTLPDGGPACTATPANILGPYYLAGAPERNVLVGPGDPGVRLTITGRVLDDRCQPVPGALVDVWQADADGRYDEAGYRLRGRFRAGDGGAWALHTIVPGHYLNGDSYRPAHLHVKVDAPGLAGLVTQLYFDDDPFNVNDPFILPSLVMHVEGPPEGPRTARFDLVLAGPGR